MKTSCWSLGFSLAALLWVTPTSAQPVIQTQYTAIAGSTVVIPVTFGQKRCVGGTQTGLLCNENGDCPLSACTTQTFTPGTLRYRVDVGNTPLVASTTVTPAAATYSVVIPGASVTIPPGTRSPATALVMLSWTDPSGQVSMQDVVFSIRTPAAVP